MMAKTELILNENYLVITGDKKTFVGKYIGSGKNSNGAELFDYKGKVMAVNPEGAMYSRYRQRPPFVHKANFAKAHLALLVYVEGRVVLHGGVLDKNHLRCNPSTHPNMMGAPAREFTANSGTVVKGEAPIRGYDDHDCLKDLVYARFINCYTSQVGAGSGTRYNLTDEGWDVAHQLRRHLAERNGSYDGFSL